MHKSLNVTILPGTSLPSKNHWLLARGHHSQSNTTFIHCVVGCPQGQSKWLTIDFSEGCKLVSHSELFENSWSLCSSSKSSFLKINMYNERKKKKHINFSLSKLITQIPYQPQTNFISQKKSITQYVLLLSILFKFQQLFWRIQFIFSNLDVSWANRQMYSILLNSYFTHWTNNLPRSITRFWWLKIIKFFAGSRAFLWGGINFKGFWE